LAGVVAWVYVSSMMRLLACRLSRTGTLHGTAPGNLLQLVSEVVFRMVFRPASSLLRESPKQ
jgi:hypothetical protein